MQNLCVLPVSSLIFGDIEWIFRHSDVAMFGFGEIRKDVRGFLARCSTTFVAMHHSIKIPYNPLFENIAYACLNVRNMPIGPLVKMAYVTFVILKSHFFCDSLKILMIFCDFLCDFSVISQ